ncbi:hypothetical protein [Priestia megaterium]|uniref:hypothetical protein n=1 Tax=Priestia megaterium TaxID=1404 RepID=UPI000BFB66E2|nr:hypothetical protein [Priestia megaterium]PGQ88178.1 hypothetical protein COA18_04440 [Priestia megaterium]
MENEIRAAVKWWTDVLASANPKHDNGDPNPAAQFLLSLSTNSLTPLSEDQLQSFREHLGEILAEKLKENWNPEEPDVGSYFRTIYNDYGADSSLRTAAELANIDRINTRFPIKTNMRIDPGRVTVARGYGSPYETIYARV